MIGCTFLRGGYRHHQQKSTSTRSRILPHVRWRKCSMAVPAVQAGVANFAVVFDSARSPCVHPLPRVRMPMLQSESCNRRCVSRTAALMSFFTHKRRYGAGVSTSGSQPENPGSIPGTATKLSRVIFSASHATKNRRVSHQIEPTPNFYSIIPHPVSLSRHLLSLPHATDQKSGMFPLPGHPIRRDAPDPLPAMQRFSLRPLRSTNVARNRRTRRHRPRSRQVPLARHVALSFCASRRAPRHSRRGLDSDAPQPPPSQRIT